MSQASRSKALRRWRVRDQVARELARAGLVRVNNIGSKCGPRSAVVAHLLDGGHFDVHAAREHARSLVALADEQTAFEDWTRSLGKGPENREHWRCSFCAWAIKEHGSRFPNATCTDGGWPGNLAREWAAKGNDRRAPMGRSLARLGQEILDALERQPSFCRCMDGCANCGGAVLTAVIAGDDGEWFCSGECADMHDDAGCPLEFDEGEILSRRERLGRHSCPECQGTGHNLRGYLPEVEASPQLRRRMWEATEPDEGTRHEGRTCWLGELADAHGVVPMRTRVTLRGKHRPRSAAPRPPTPDQWRGYSIDERIEERGAFDTIPMDRWPKCRRGEFRHAEQRRARRGSG